MLFPLTVLTEACVTTSDGVHANAFSLAARVKISASKKKGVNNIFSNQLGILELRGLDQATRAVWRILLVFCFVFFSVVFYTF